MFEEEVVDGLDHVGAFKEVVFVVIAVVVVVGDNMDPNISFSPLLVLFVLIALLLDPPPTKLSKDTSLPVEFTSVVAGCGDEPALTLRVCSSKDFTSFKCLV